MKIKSGATGEMVEIRIGDFFCFGSLKAPCEIRSQDDIDFLEQQIKGGSVATFVHRPFQVGDEVEHMFCPPDNWRRIDLHHKNSVLAANADREHFRHANPSLRDAPEYKP